MATSSTTPKTIDTPQTRSARTFALGELIGKIVTYLILSFWAVLVIFPMLWSIMTSFKTDAEIFFSPWALPKMLMFENFARAWVKARIGDLSGQYAHHHPALAVFNPAALRDGLVCAGAFRVPRARLYHLPVPAGDDLPHLPGPGAAVLYHAEDWPCWIPTRA